MTKKKDSVEKAMRDIRRATRRRIGNRCFILPIRRPVAFGNDVYTHPKSEEAHCQTLAR